MRTNALKFAGIILIVISSIACKKDAATSTALIVGNWKFVTYSDTLFSSNGSVVSSISLNAGSNDYANFLPNGTLYSTSSYGVYPTYDIPPSFSPNPGYYSDTATYTQVGNTLIYKIKDVSEEETIHTLTNSQLIMSRTEFDTILGQIYTWESWVILKR